MRENSIGLLEEVAERTQLREGPEGVAEVLRGVYAAGTIPLRDLSRQVTLPVPVLAAVRRELERAGILERGGGLALTEKGHSLGEERLVMKSDLDPTCPRCQGRGNVLGEAAREALTLLRDHFPGDPPVDVRLDQAPCTPESSVRRALFMLQRGALEGKRVVILGDDDLVSVAIAFLGRTIGNEKMCRRITVLEIDSAHRERVRQVAKRERLEIECVSHDLRQPLPAALRGRFDTFQTDPPYTLPGLGLFLSRALVALEPGRGKQGFLSFASKSPGENLLVQRVLADLGLATQRILEAFNEYQGASALAGISRMIHLVTTAQTQVSDSDDVYLGPLYTGELNPSLRIYRCTQCKERIQVGQNSCFQTIEVLKEARCPSCRNDRFTLVARRRVGNR